jgi:hypothetical protein
MVVIFVSHFDDVIHIIPVIYGAQRKIGRNVVAYGINFHT